MLGIVINYFTDLLHTALHTLTSYILTLIRYEGSVFGKVLFAFSSVGFNINNVFISLQFIYVNSLLEVFFDFFF